MSDRCTVIVHRDGSIETNHPATGFDAETAFKTLAYNDRHPMNPAPVGYDELEHFEVDVDDLPPEGEDCASCGEQHSNRDKWVVTDGAVVVDPSLPSLPAVYRHLIQRQDAELDGARDVGVLMLLDRAITKAQRAFALSIRERGPVVAELEAALVQAGKS